MTSGKHANGAWWIGVEERQTDEPSSLLGQLGGLFAHGPTTPSQDCSIVCGRPHFTLRAGFEAPTWHALARGARPGPREPEEIEPGAVRRGWQHNASSEVEKHARIQLFSRVSDQARARCGLRGALVLVLP